MGEPEVVVCVLLGAGLVAAFIAWEHRARTPMLPMSFFRSRTFSSATAASFLMFATLYGGVFFITQLMQVGFGTGHSRGFLLVPWTATLLVVAPAAGALGDKVGERPVVVAGLVVQAVGLASLALLAEPNLAYWKLALALVCTGIGASAVIPVVQSALLAP